MGDLLGEPGEVGRKAFRADPVVLPGGVHVAHREVRAGRVELTGPAEGSHRFRPEMKRPPGQSPAEVLQLGVAPALGLADLFRDRLGV